MHSPRQIFIAIGVAVVTVGSLAVSPVSATPSNKGKNDKSNAAVSTLSCSISNKAPKGSNASFIVEFKKNAVDITITSRLGAKVALSKDSMPPELGQSNSKETVRQLHAP